MSAIIKKEPVEQKDNLNAAKVAARLLKGEMRQKVKM